MRKEIDAKSMYYRVLNKMVRDAVADGFTEIILKNVNGQYYIGDGIDKNVKIFIDGVPGNDLGAFMDGPHVVVNSNAQDNVGNTMNSGKIVIHGDVGQTFLYGAKGGEVYVLGNTAGRPLINSVGTIRAVINGTCLDYAAESFMAGSETGGGFILINGLRANAYGEFMGLEEKFPGSNFFSLASGGAGYLNDPYRPVTEGQLNGGEFVEFTQNRKSVV